MMYVGSCLLCLVYQDQWSQYIVSSKYLVSLFYCLFKFQCLSLFGIVYLNLDGSVFIYHHL